MNNLDQNSLRKELKFKILELDRTVFMSWLFSFSGFTKAYPGRNVSSIYYDTVDYDFAYSNMTGESNRTKIRLRWYPPSAGALKRLPTKCFLERKRKANDLSDKVILAEKDFADVGSVFREMEATRDWVNANTMHNTSSEVSYLKEAVIVSYGRHYYRHILVPDLRLTIDYNIQFYDVYNAALSKQLSKDYFIVELKYRQKDEAAVNAIMREFPFRRSRYSKYLSAMVNLKNISY